MNNKHFLAAIAALFTILLTACNGGKKDFQVDNTLPISSQNRIIYEMNVGAFTPEGTFAAAQARLDELHTLGIDIVWLMPIYPRGETKNSPYASMDFRQVNPKYGTVDDVKSFVARAHELGMEVWLDWVPNHVAVENPWVKSHPEYFTKDKSGKMINPFGWMDVYELNYQDAGLVEEMNSTMKFWAGEVGVDGFRCDYVSSPTIPIAYWQNIIGELKSLKQGKAVTMMSETDITDPNNARIDSCGFDYDYAWNFQGTLAYKFGKEGHDADSLKAICEKFLADSKTIKNRRMAYLTNHDQNFNDGGHTLKDFYGDNRYALTVLEFTFYGMPLLYNGQEIGGNQLLDYFNDSKVNWQDVDPKMKNTVRSLIALKHTLPALADDNEPVFLETDKAAVMAYCHDNVVVVMNLSTDNVEAKVNRPAGKYRMCLDSKTIAEGPTTQRVELSPKEPISLEPKGYAVYVRK